MQLTRNVARKYGAKALSVKATIGAAFLALGSAAFAALPESVATDVGIAKNDMLAGIALVIGAMVAVWGLMKLGRKLGWM